MYTYIRGTLFQFAGQMQNDGVVQDLTNATLSANLYDETGTTLISALTVTVIGDPTQGMVQLGYSGNTLLWPTGKAACFFLLQLPNNAEPLASEPMYLRIGMTPMLG